jgi:hypothetical protein
MGTNVVQVEDKLSAAMVAVRKLRRRMPRKATRISLPWI